MKALINIDVYLTDIRTGTSWERDFYTDVTGYI
jgi:hypothetical protein